MNLLRPLQSDRWRITEVSQHVFHSRRQTEIKIHECTYMYIQTDIRSRILYHAASQVVNNSKYKT